MEIVGLFALVAGTINLGLWLLSGNRRDGIYGGGLSAEHRRRLTGLMGVPDTYYSDIQPFVSVAAIIVGALTLAFTVLA